LRKNVIETIAGVCSVVEGSLKIEKNVNGLLRKAHRRERERERERE
jgi:hypothetical protein